MLLPGQRGNDAEEHNAVDELQVVPAPVTVQRIGFQAARNKEITKSGAAPCKVTSSPFL